MFGFQFSKEQFHCSEAIDEIAPAIEKHLEKCEKCRKNMIIKIKSKIKIKKYPRFRMNCYNCNLIIPMKHRQEDWNRIDVGR